MTQSEYEPHPVTPPSVVEAIGAINARLGWPGGWKLLPCVGHMVPDHEPVEGIDVIEVDGMVEFRVAGVLVGAGARWPGWGNAQVRCLLPHASWLDPSQYQTALHPGSAANAFQQHLLTQHAPHGPRRGDQERSAAKPAADPSAPQHALGSRRRRSRRSGDV